MLQTQLTPCRYMGAGCLTDVLDQFESVRLSEAQIAFCTKEVLKSLIYIHSMHRIHRDIKSDNVLVRVSAAGLLPAHRCLLVRSARRARSSWRTLAMPRS
jgi:hypothetical protein